MLQLKHAKVEPTPPHIFNCPMAVKMDNVSVDDKGELNFTEYKASTMQGIIAHQMAELELIYGGSCHRYFNKRPSSTKRFGRRG